MCVWDPVYGVDGPHPYGQWGVYMPNEYVAEVVSWMSANHGEFEVLFHPNTGYMVGGTYICLLCSMNLCDVCMHILLKFLRINVDIFTMRW